MRMSAAMLKKVDQYELIANLALFSRQAMATNKKGTEYLIKKADEIYNAKAIEKKILGVEKQDQTFIELMRRAKRLQEYRKGKANGE